MDLIASSIDAPLEDGRDQHKLRPYVLDDTTVERLMRVVAQRSEVDRSESQIAALCDAVERVVLALRVMGRPESESISFASALGSALAEFIIDCLGRAPLRTWRPALASDRQT